MPTPFKGQNYSSIKKDCLEKGVLFEDPEFPAYSEVDSDVEWKRPSELCEKPKLVVNGKASDDLTQGELGNCWFVTAGASLAHEKVLFQSVVPNLKKQEWNEKSDKPSYAGIFHFQFWRFGEWIDVVIDDRLPTKNDNLIYCHSEADNEFWSSLVEKAYAKLHGGYASLKTGRTEDALVDFTGAMAEKVILSKLSLNEPKEIFTLFRKLRNDIDSHALLTCIIDCPVEQIGTRGNQGLIKGHGYIINKFLRIKMEKGLQGEVGSGELMMLRLSNPWGPSEWTGPWSKGAPEWQKVKQSEWQKLGLSLERDGEFWMAFDDFVKHYSNVDIHHFENTSFFAFKKSWQENIFHGEWNVSERSGGSEIISNPVFSHPQFMFDIVSQQDKIMVSLEQHDGLQLNEIGFQIMKVEENRRYRVHISRQLTYESVYMQSRSIFGTTELKKGRYVLMPITKNPGDTGKFMVRLCTGNLASFSNTKELTDECPKGKCKCVKNSELATRINVVPADVKVLPADVEVLQEEENTRKLLSNFTKVDCRGETQCQQSLQFITIPELCSRDIIWKTNMPMDDYRAESRTAGHGMCKQNCYIVFGSLDVVCKA
ncbi:hypothetical protein ACJMK2_026437 [Sinanodonta woodiana]|uniref:Calpain catalytic domain-containing protein n=1 Tax=Sinanodonta woodiana TaxID=1069815 RepID=A0ABD3XJL0_SINWO